MPYNPFTGRRASSTDSRTWSTFSDVLAAYEEGLYAGIGFVLSSGDPFVGLDFDKCRDPKTGAINAAVLERIARFEHRYVEASPSGTGVHLITYGKLREGANKGGREIYGQDRFLTFTGEVIDV